MEFTPAAHAAIKNDLIRRLDARSATDDQAINQAFPRKAKIMGGELSVSATFKWVELRAGVGVIHDRQRSSSDFSALISLNVLL